MGYFAVYLVLCSGAVCVNWPSGCNVSTYKISNLIIIIVVIITQNIRDAFMLSVTCKNWPAARCLTAVNLVFRDIHIFKKRNLKQTLLQIHLSHSKLLIYFSITNQYCLLLASSSIEVLTCS